MFTLQLGGVPLPVALSATLLFRGLSFWLPMIPGAWLARRLFGVSHDESLGQLGAAYWGLAPDELMRRLESTLQGLTSAQAAERLKRFGANQLRVERPMSRLRVLLRQLSSPLLLLLVFAAIVAAATGELADATIILTILCASALIGYRREYSAHTAAMALRQRIKSHTKVVRDGTQQSIPMEEVVPGDIALLSAGDLVPAAWNP